MQTVNTLTVVASGTPPPKKPKLSNRAFDDFVADLDRIVKARNEIKKIVEAIDGSGMPKDVVRARNEGPANRQLATDFTETCAKCRAFEEMFNADKWDEVDEMEPTLKPAYIANRLALLINGFPSNGPKHPDSSR